MSFIAKITFGSDILPSEVSQVVSIGDDDYNVLQADYEMTQPLNHQHMPSGKPDHSVINVTIESGKKTKSLLQWMNSPNEKRTGKIIFYRRDNISAMRTLEFKDAYCINYREFFNSTGSSPMTLHLKISAGWISIDKIEFIKPWSTQKATPVGLFERFANDVSDARDTIDDGKDKVDDTKDKVDGVDNTAKDTASYTEDLYHSGANVANDGYKGEQAGEKVADGDKDTIRSFNPMSDGYDDGQADQDKKDKADKDDATSDRQDGKDAKNDPRNDDSSSDSKDNSNGGSNNNSSSGQEKQSGPDPETPGLGGGNQDGSENA